ncbi:TetR/AcrR family transcriptional regulator [Dactylosporangium sp. CA-233914]|uniref:TetR/AcrR family transcriptional regulator n=1 Tax=Dactylosporangium sp. CA-233914 TaxID=3239934 RepID=UPI003D8F6B65
MAMQTRGGRTAVLQGAIRLFTKVGFHGASVRDIARECDVTVASIYYHFSSKQEILQEIMATILTDVIAETRAAVLAAGSGPDQQLRALVRAWVLFHTRRQSEALIGASEIRSLDEDGHRQIVALRNEQENLFRGVVDRGVSEGVFATPYPHQASRAIINMGRTVVDWYHVGGRTSPEQIADEYAELALALVQSHKGLDDHLH